MTVFELILYRNFLIFGIAEFTAQRMEEIRKIKEAIAHASSLEEVERLNQLLQSGQIPGRNEYNSHGGNIILFFIGFFSDLFESSCYRCEKSFRSNVAEYHLQLAVMKIWERDECFTRSSF